MMSRISHVRHECLATGAIQEDFKWQLSCRSSLFTFCSILSDYRRSNSHLPLCSRQVAHQVRLEDRLCRMDYSKRPNGLSCKPQRLFLSQRIDGTNNYRPRPMLTHPRNLLKLFVREQPESVVAFDWRLHSAPFGPTSAELIINFSALCFLKPAVLCSSAHSALLLQGSCLFVVLPS